MACTKPLSGYRAPDGTLRFSGETHTVLLTRKQEITVACGQCLDCRLERSRQWAVRMTHEAKTHPFNSFVTLTYSDANLPEDKSLNVRDWQLFAKRLRKLHPFRYYHCGEYGDQTGRPHYHAAMFGVDFSGDRTPLKITRNGDQLYRSELLEDLWELGQCFIGDLTFESAAYIARYVMKKQTGKNAVSSYESSECDPDTGEVIDLAPPYATMSLNPGIGKPWLDRFMSDVYPRDEVYINGKYTRPPTYYDKLYEKAHPEAFEKLKAKRRTIAEAKPAETLERMATRDTCTQARVNLERS